MFPPRRTSRLRLYAVGVALGGLLLTGCATGPAADRTPRASAPADTSSTAEATPSEAPADGSPQSEAEATEAPPRRSRCSTRP